MSETIRIQFLWYMATGLFSQCLPILPNFHVEFHMLTLIHSVMIIFASWKELTFTKSEEIGAKL